MLKNAIFGLVAVVALASTSVANAQVIFRDDFEDYPVSNPSDFRATGNWTHNGVVGGNADNADRIFETPNFGGSLLWIAHPDSNGSGINSPGIGVLADTEYTLTANFVAETFNGLRDNEFAVDFLLGSDFDTASSILASPITVIGRGDAPTGVNGEPGDDSYDDQITTIDFTTGALGAGDQLFLSLVYVGPGPSANPGFAGIDNVSLSQVPEPGSLAMLFVAATGLLVARRRRR